MLDIARSLDIIRVTECNISALTWETVVEDVQILGLERCVTRVNQRADVLVVTRHQSVTRQLQRRPVDGTYVNHRSSTVVSDVWWTAGRAFDVVLTVERAADVDGSVVRAAQAQDVQLTAVVIEGAVG